MHKKIRDLIQAKDTCVLATVSGNIPHCSLMAYLPGEECREIYMITQKKTKKYENLTQNPQVSLLMDTREKDHGPRRNQAKALTLNGQFQRITDEGQKNSIRSRFLKKHAHLKKLINHPDAEIFYVRVSSCQLLEGAMDSYFEAID